MHPQQGHQRTLAQRAAGIIAGERDVAEAAVDIALGQRQKPNEVGEQDQRARPGDQQPDRQAQSLAQPASEQVIQPGQRHEQPQRKDGAGDGVAQTGHTHDQAQPPARARLQAQSVDHDHPGKHGEHSGAQRQLQRCQQGPVQVRVCEQVEPVQRVAPQHPQRHAETQQHGQAAPDHGQHGPDPVQLLSRWRGAGAAALCLPPPPGPALGQHQHEHEDQQHHGQLRRPGDVTS